MSDFITTIVTPGAPIFDEIELAVHANGVREAREVYKAAQREGEFASDTYMLLSTTALAAAENRYAAMLLHNRLCALERRLLEEGI